MPRLVVDLEDRRPILRIPEWAVEQIRSGVPGGWEVTVVRSPTDGTADGGGSASPEVLAAVEDAEVYLGYGVPPEVLRVGARLRWVHSGTAGVGSSLTPEMRARDDVVFTNSAGVYAPAMAETVLAMMLYFARGLDRTLAQQWKRRWDKAWFNAADSPVREVGRSTVGILGFGGIGREVARRARALGARVLAVKRRPGGEMKGVELCYGREGRERVLAESDYLVLAVPETPETRGLVDAEALDRMPPHAVLVNVARGTVVDEDALVEALREGRLRGAALDVFATEPLPEDHPLWRLPNVLVTPHVSGYSHHFWERETELILDNLERYLSGRPLLNVVDKDAGY